MRVFLLEAVDLQSRASRLSALSSYGNRQIKIGDYLFNGIRTKHANNRDARKKLWPSVAKAHNNGVRALLIADKHIGSVNAWDRAKFSKAIKYKSFQSKGKKFTDKDESITRSGFKIDRVHTQDGAQPTSKITQYQFKHKQGRGYVTVMHGKGKESKLDFHVGRTSRKPDVKNAVGVLKTVEKVLRHHLRTEKPKVVGFHAMADEHDRGGRNRREAIYSRIARKLAGKKWKEVPVTGSMAGRHRFQKVGR